MLRHDSMLILLGIGPVGPIRIVSDVALDETPLGEPGLAGWDLDITLKPEFGDLQHRRLRLPLTGSSRDVSFPVEVDPAADHWRGRFTVRHNGRAIQSAILSSPVVETDTASQISGRPSLFVDGEFRSMVELERQTSGGATIELDDTPAVYCRDDQWLIEPRETEMLAASNKIAAKLGELAVDLDEAAGLDDPSSRALLLFAAVQGSHLLEALLPTSSNARRWSPNRSWRRFASTTPPPNCRTSSSTTFQALPTITSCAPSGSRESPPASARDATRRVPNLNVLCPLGFWGISKVIERHNAVERTRLEPRRDCGAATSRAGRSSQSGGRRSRLAIRLM